MNQVITITARGFVSGSVSTFRLTKDECMDLCYGHPTFRNNFELVYRMELIAITHNFPNEYGG